MPTFWQSPIVSFFPNNNMLKDITLFSSSWMFRFIDDYVAPTMFEPTTLPMRTSLPPTSQITTRSTQFGCGLLGIPTIGAGNILFKPSFSLLSKFTFSMFYAILAVVFFSIHTLHYNIRPNNIQALAFVYEEEGTKFSQITPYYGD